MCECQGEGPRGPSPIPFLLAPLGSAGVGGGEEGSGDRTHLLCVHADGNVVAIDGSDEHGSEVVADPVRSIGLHLHRHATVAGGERPDRSAELAVNVVRSCDLFGGRRILNAALTAEAARRVGVRRVGWARIGHHQGLEAGEELGGAVHLTVSVEGVDWATRPDAPILPHAADGVKPPCNIALSDFPRVFILFHQVDCTTRCLRCQAECYRTCHVVT